MLSCRANNQTARPRGAHRSLRETPLTSGSADQTRSSTQYLGVWSTTTDANGNAVAQQVDDPEESASFCDGPRRGPGRSNAQPLQGMTFTYLPFSVVGTVTDIVGNVITTIADRLGRELSVADPDLPANVPIPTTHSATCCRRPKASPSNCSTSTIPLVGSCWIERARWQRELHVGHRIAWRWRRSRR